MAESKELQIYRPHAIAAAKDLFYGEEVIKKIKAAKTVGEIEQIMRTARRERFGK